MPVGCKHQFIVVKRRSVLRELERAAENGDMSKVAFARMLLARVHSDNYLIVIGDMDGTGDDYDFENLRLLGLKAHDGNRWIDFYAPHLTKLPAKWLMYSPIRQLHHDGTHGPVIWDGYRHISDKSTHVAVWEDKDYPAIQLEPFPNTAQIAW